MRINGKLIQEEIKRELKTQVQSLKHKPTLAVICAGEHPAISQYVKKKQQFGNEIGVDVKVISLPSNVSSDEIVGVVKTYGQDEKISAMIVQLPLPSGIKTQEILDLIPAKKDVDILSSTARESFAKGSFPILPPTVAAIKEILQRNNVSLEKKSIAVMGQGQLVGAPTITWLKSEGVLPEVITKETQNTSEITSRADIIITGVGLPGVLTPNLIKGGAVLIDAGTSEDNGKIVGDIDPQCQEKASLFTPVPGGVGPITVAMLFKNVFALAAEQGTI